MGAVWIIIVVAVVAVNIFSAAMKAKNKQGESAGYTAQGQQQYYRTQNAPVGKAQQPTYQPYNAAAGRPATYTGTRTPTRAPSAQQNAADAHLCEPGEHIADSEKDYRAALHDMEPGYRAHTPPKTTIRSARNKMLRLSAEEVRKKTEGLKDLRDAGIISDAEYAQQIRALH